MPAVPQYKERSVLWLYILILLAIFCSTCFLELFLLLLTPPPHRNRYWGCIRCMTGSFVCKDMLSKLIFLDKFKSQSNPSPWSTPCHNCKLHRIHLSSISYSVTAKRLELADNCLIHVALRDQATKKYSGICKEQACLGSWNAPSEKCTTRFTDFGNVCNVVVVRNTTFFGCTKSLISDLSLFTFHALYSCQIIGMSNILFVQSSALFESLWIAVVHISGCLWGISNLHENCSLKDRFSSTPCFACSVHNSQTSIYKTMLLVTTHAHLARSFQYTLFITPSFFSINACRLGYYA